MDTRKFTHHSITDWDWQGGVAGRSLDPTVFISPPSSLRMYYATTYPQYSILCRDLLVRNLPQGEIRMWRKGHRTDVGPACFRNQNALGTANFSPGYSIKLGLPNCQILRDITIIGTLPITVVIDVWEHWRVRWYNSEDGAGNPALAIEIYKEVAGAWVSQIGTFYDTQNKYKDSAINRVGFRTHAAFGSAENYDDTEIWGP